MAAYTSTQNGNWSAQSTWGGSGPPGIGDTATIAHTVTVDVNTTVGTSPNDTTTMVVTVNTTKTLIIASSVTLTIRGNMSAAFHSVFQMNSGAALVFDNAASGGSPVYNFAPNFMFATITGTALNHCSISAISGQAFTMNSATAWDTSSVTYLDVTRMNLSTWGLANSGAKSFTHCSFSSCGVLTIDDNNTAFPFTFTDNVFSATTGSAGSFKFNFASSAGANIRTASRNVVDAFVTHNAKDFTIVDNYFGGGITCTAGRKWTSFSKNFSRMDGNVLNGGNGALMTASIERNYFVCESSGGNPHYLQPTALLSANNVVSQNVFESQTPDLVDVGDCLIIKDTGTSGGFAVIARNNICLPSGYSGANVSSGTIGTLFNLAATCLTEWYRNTCNVQKDATQSRGVVLALAESGTGTAGQAAAFKSNLAWASSSGQGFLAERVSGNVKDIITAAGADRNWTYNTSAGDNQRGYDDRAANNTLWTAGDAVAASVDANQGSGNPQFYDSARNMAAWAVARGYGSTYANALTALQAAPTRVADLINYVFEGFRPQNSACRNAAHDGGCVGAANFARSRYAGFVTSHRSALSKFAIS